jgi:hypothetical protein
MAHLDAVRIALVGSLAQPADEGAISHNYIFVAKNPVLLAAIGAGGVLGQLRQLAQHVLDRRHAKGRGTKGGGAKGAKAPPAAKARTAQAKAANDGKSRRQGRALPSG